MRLSLCTLLWITAAAPSDAQDTAARTNVILIMADDQGFGDVGFRGHPILKTPHLDELAASGLCLDRFYAAAPVCSPTRGSCLTGRHPSRFGVMGANKGHLRSDQPHLAQILHDRGWRTGFFGKWHLGTLSKDVVDSNRGGRAKHLAHYCTPWDRAFDEAFCTEAKVPTYHPMLKPGTDEPYGTAYWKAPGQRATEDLDGDDSRIIMDRALPFVRRAVADDRPFFMVVWFHAPHLPTVAGPEQLAQYAEVEQEKHRHYYGCISALDAQVGRLRRELRELGVADDTMLWYCSDNGPEGPKTAEGRTGGFRGRKRSLYEGGLRVPAMVEWPARIRAPRVVKTACTTSDYLPTILAALGIEVERLPADGVDLGPVLAGGDAPRERPIGFLHQSNSAWIEGDLKIVRKGKDEVTELYDLAADPFEEEDLAARRPEVLAAMQARLDAWIADCDADRARRGRP